MVKQNKNKTIETLEQVGSHIGVAVMLVAVGAGIIEFAEKEAHRVTATLQPAYSMSAAHHDVPGQGEQQIRRSGKEEIRHTSASYGALMRTNSVSGPV